VPYAIDHATTPDGDLQSVSIANGDTLRVDVVNTNTACFDFNIVDKHAESFRKETSKRLEAIHDEATTAYLVTVTKHSSGCDTETLPSRNWRLPVRPLWNLAFTGGVAKHRLVDKQYFLAPGKDPKDNTTSGFTVERDTTAEDTHKIVGTAMSHLYMSGPSWAGISWAPLSFGLSVDSDKPAYLVGTGLRLGTRAFLTVGRVYGSVARLPTGTTEHGFTTDANLLTNLPSRAADSTFIGISFSLLDKGVSHLLTSKLGVPVPVADTTSANNGSRAGQTDRVADSVSVTPNIATDHDPVTLAGKGFGARDPTSVLVLGGDPPISSTDTTVVTNWSDTEIVFLVPAHFAPAAEEVRVTAEVKVGGGSKGVGHFTVPKK